MSKLTPFFKELLEKRWSEFVQQEKDESYTSSQAVVFSLIRACAKGKLPAIKQALDRIDGKVAIEIEVEYPKFYFTYPYATSVAGLPAGKTTTKKVAKAEDEEELPDEPVTNSLRDTLKRMSEQPRSLVGLIMETSKAIDKLTPYDDPPQSDPLVKSVIVAGLLQLAHNGSLGAIFEILDQIDGRVADKIKLLGGDVHLSRMDEIAPAGAVKNAEGIYQIEADNTTNAWAASLERTKSNGR